MHCITEKSRSYIIGKMIWYILQVHTKDWKMNVITGLRESYSHSSCIAIIWTRRHAFYMRIDVNWRICFWNPNRIRSGKPCACVIGGIYIRTRVWTNKRAWWMCVYTVCKFIPQLRCEERRNTDLITVLVIIDLRSNANIASRRWNF
jgi:hypothetical protein